MDDVDPVPFDLTVSSRLAGTLCPGSSTFEAPPDESVLDARDAATQHHDFPTQRVKYSIEKAQIQHVQGHRREHVTLGCIDLIGKSRPRRSGGHKQVDS